jgi:hypothetical protein
MLNTIKGYINSKSASVIYSVCKQMEKRKRKKRKQRKKKKKEGAEFNI